MRLASFLRHGGRIAWSLLFALVLVVGASAVLAMNTARVRLRRDITRMAYNDNLALLDQVRQSIGAEDDSLAALLDGSPQISPHHQPYIVISIEDHRLWYRDGDSVLFSAPVAVGSGKVLEVGGGGARHWRFDTPRGRLLVQGKDTAPVWVPPDWHYVEQARKRGLGLVRLNRGEKIPTADGGWITVSGSDVVKRTPQGRTIALTAREGHEIVANGNIVVPPYGTNQRRYKDVLGSFRLDLGDGYGIHGTDSPASIGRSVSHGCVRLRNRDISTLFGMVSVGTPVFIY